MYDIIIPSCKPYVDVNIFTSLIKQFDPQCSNYNYIPTGFQVSASINRNYGLLKSFQSNNEFIIMIDDDIGGFYEGWQNDLIQPLKDDKNVSISSARLLTEYGHLSPMNGPDTDIDKPLSICKNMVLSAAIAFRKADIIQNNQLRFCMKMIGSGWEDTLFCKLFNKVYPEGKFVVNNNCRLIHFHEMKKQSEYFDYNRKVYLSELKKVGLHE